MNDLEFIGKLWLHEPSQSDVDRAENESGLASRAGADAVARLAEAYANLFLLNVFPYGSAFTDPEGELNGTSARAAVAAFEELNFLPPELREVAAPDHMGLCLKLVARIPLSHFGQPAESSSFAAFVRDFVAWSPACCIAVEREPDVDAFYHALAGHTRRAVLESEAGRAGASWAGTAPGAQDEDPEAHASLDAGAGMATDSELWLSDVLRFFLTPARCGMFLSRARLGHLALQLDAGGRVPFGTRYEVARSLFSVAGETGNVAGLLDLLQRESAEWGREFRKVAEVHPVWRGCSDMWLSRIAETSRLLGELRMSLPNG